MGYNGQTEYLTNTSTTVDSATTTPPWTCSTGDSCNPAESQGGGDILYQNDVNLVNNALNTLVSKTKKGTADYYWISSRYYNYKSSTTWRYIGRYITNEGILNTNYWFYYYNGQFAATHYDHYRLRPILTLKSNLQANGNGTSVSPYILS